MGRRLPVIRRLRSHLRQSGHEPDAWKRYGRYRRGVRVGQVVMVVAGVIATVHLLAHLGALGGPPTGWQDLLVGYPAAGLIFLGGAYLAGRTAPK